MDELSISNRVSIFYRAVANDKDEGETRPVWNALAQICEDWEGEGAPEGEDALRIERDVTDYILARPFYKVAVLAQRGRTIQLAFPGSVYQIYPEVA